MDDELCCSKKKYVLMHFDVRTFLDGREKQGKQTIDTWRVHVRSEEQIARDGIRDAFVISVGSNATLMKCTLKHGRQGKRTQGKMNDQLVACTRKKEK